MARFWATGGGLDSYIEPVQDMPLVGIKKASFFSRLVNLCGGWFRWFLIRLMNCIVQVIHIQVPALPILQNEVTIQHPDNFHKGVNGVGM